MKQKNISKLYSEQHVRVEAPRPIGADVEFFLQRHNPSSVATFSHIHSAIELIYINEGDYVALLDGNEYRLAKGDLLLVPSNTVHYIAADDGCAHSYYVMKVSPLTLIDSAGDDNTDNLLIRLCNGGTFLRRFWNKSELSGGNIHGVIHRMIEEHSHPTLASQLVIRLKMIELLIEVLRSSDVMGQAQSGEVDALIYTVLRHVNKHFSEDMDERKIAARIGVSYGYFVRAFHDTVGMSFRKYLNTVRIGRAQQMLLTGQGNVSEVAAECGFNSVSYFISTYRMMKGETPKATYQRRVDKGLSTEGSGVT